MANFQNNEKSEFRVLIISFSDGKNTVQAKQWLDKCSSDSTPLVTRWFADFKRSCIDTNDT